MVIHGSSSLRQGRIFNITRKRSIHFWIIKISLSMVSKCHFIYFVGVGNVWFKNMITIQIMICFQLYIHKSAETSAAWLWWNWNPYLEDRKNNDNNFFFWTASSRLNCLHHPIILHRYTIGRRQGFYAVFCWLCITIRVLFFCVFIWLCLF